MPITKIPEGGRAFGDPRCVTLGLVLKPASMRSTNPRVQHGAETQNGLKHETNPFVQYEYPPIWVGSGRPEVVAAVSMKFF